MSLVRRTLVVCALSLFPSFFFAPVADARDVTFGLRGNISDDADFGVGADVRWTFLPDDPRLALDATFDYYFPEEGNDDIEDALEQFEDLFPGLDLPVDLGELVDLATPEKTYWEANLNLTWDFTRGGAVVPYAGLGANYARLETKTFGFTSDEDDFGANVLAGLRIQDRFYVEAKQEFGGGDMFVLSAGVRF